MKYIIPSLAAPLLLAATITTSNAAIVFTLDQTAGNAGGSAILDGSGGWDFEAGGPWANVYYDADQDDVFGEIADGDTSGDTNASLNFTQTISNGLTLNFAVEGFGGSGGSSDSFRFNVQNTDLTTQTITVNASSTTDFSDSNGDQWSVAYAFTAQGYGDVVTNLNSTPGNNAQDHKAVLTFTQVPEPSSVTLLGLGGLALILRRRK